MRKGIAFLMAAAAGLAVANVYYAQPVLDAMAGQMGLDASTAGLIVTLTQLGYFLGLFLLVPLGDLLHQRRLILAHFGLLVPALLGTALAPGLGALGAALFAVGLLSVVVQSLVAHAAKLVVPGQRGATVGTVTSGIVLGLLLARTVAGALDAVAGWRAIYFVAAGASALMLGLLTWRLPHVEEAGARRSRGNYAGLVLSIPRLFTQDGLLLSRGLIAFFLFAALGTLWSALVLPLSEPPFNLPHGIIGLFGLAGAAGVLAAGSAGKLADRGHGQATTGWALLMLLASWPLVGLLTALPRAAALIALLAGIVLLDAAVQAVHVSNQSLMLQRHPEAGSRLIGGYMMFYSLGSGAGAIASTSAYAVGGWWASCVLGAGYTLAALGVWGGYLWRARRVAGNGAMLAPCTPPEPQVAPSVRC